MVEKSVILSLLSLCGFLPATSQYIPELGKYLKSRSENYTEVRRSTNSMMYQLNFRRWHVNNGCSQICSKHTSVSMIHVRNTSLKHDFYVEFSFQTIVYDENYDFALCAEKLKGYKKEEIGRIFDTHILLFQPHFERFIRILDTFDNTTAASTADDLELKVGSHFETQTPDSVSFFQLGSYLADNTNFAIDELKAELREWSQILNNEQCFNIMSIQGQRYGRYVDLFIVYILNTQGMYFSFLA